MKYQLCSFCESCESCISKLICLIENRRFRREIHLRVQLPGVSRSGGSVL